MLLSSVQDTLTGLESNALQRPFVSTEAAMNARQILWDLVVSARVHHVQFRTGYELGEKSVLTDATQPGRILGVTLRSRHGGQPDLYVTAEQYIFALGAGIEDTRLRAQIRMDVKTQKRKSVVVAVAPSPLDREAAHAGPLSVVWMGYGQSADFNVIAHRGLPKTPNESYCLISDSNSLPADASYEECAEVANRLIAKAAQYLKGVGTPGPADNLDRKMVSILFERTASWYVCEKNEVLFNERVGKEYSYWFGPSRFQWEANSGREQRKANPQRTTQDELRVITLSAEKDKDSRHLLLSKQRNLPGPILGSIWATKKVLHFAAYRLLAGDLNVKEFKTFRDGLVRQLDEIFQRDRGWIDGLPEEERESIRVIDRNPASKENYLCIVPGKFSLFPTVAHQVYLEMEVRTLYTGEKSPAKPREQVANARKDADGLVGASKGVEALLRRKPQAH